MSKKLRIVISIFLFLAFSSSSSPAASFLYDWAFNVNGGLYESEAGINDPNNLPGYFDDSGFDWDTGLGNITITLNPGAVGNNYLMAFFDHEIDQAANTFFNEYGISSGTAASGQTWEIYEPGFGSLQNGTAVVPYFGDIYSNIQNGTLDNQAFFDALDKQHLIPPYDVSMSMGWDFFLANVGDQAVIELILSDSVEPSGFYLTHTDPDSNASIYFSSSLTVTDGPAPIPEPATILLVGTDLAGLFGLGRRRFKK